MLVFYHLFFFILTAFFCDNPHKYKPLFKVDNSVAFSLLTELCNHHPSSTLEYFHHSKKKSCTPRAVVPHFLPTTNLFFVSMGLLILDISYKWNHAMWSFVTTYELLSFSIMFPRFIQVVACISSSLLFFKKNYLFIYLFMAVLGLRFCARAFSSCGKRGPLFIAVRGPLTIAASLVAEPRLQTRRLSNCGSPA